MANDTGVHTGADDVPRCWWCGDDELYTAYHDDEWGMPTADDQRLFEKICLEGFQAGLSWLTILRKREHFRAAFKDFDFHNVARFTKRDITRLLKDAGIVRHRGKIESTINNAQRTLEIIDEFGSLGAYIWGFEPTPADRPKKIDKAAVCALVHSDHSKALSKALKKRGFSFVGPTTMYAFMQSMGMVNDHLEGCSARIRVEQARAAFTRPG